MVSPKPNETRIAGKVREIRAATQQPDLVELVLEVERAEDIEGRANLLANTPGQALAMTTNASDLDDLDLQPGERVVLGAEVRGPGAVWSRPRTVQREA